MEEFGKNLKNGMGRGLGSVGREGRDGKEEEKVGKK